MAGERMTRRRLSRRDVLKTGAATGMGAALGAPLARVGALGRGGLLLPRGVARAKRGRRSRVER